MAKKYKIGDKVVCLKNIYYDNSVIFTSGEYYTISNVGHIYYIIDGVSFYIEDDKVCSLGKYFGSLQEYRKLKLDKLKSYGNQNIQSML